ncbi:DNA replication complex subunit Gins51 [Haloplanus sp. C73]|uniref:DNA replication complex subunit Gins51 n=1 Tax=Haloplanus sp. C73 TaxID=3421641 RepID=UPI003EBE49F6
MNVEELRTVQRTERQKDSLQHLRDSFYRDVAEYIAERKAERERVADEADDPFSSPEVSRLTDEIETAEEVVESIYERRIGKIVKRATFAAAGMATEDEGLTHEERDLFEDLVARIETNRETVLDALAGGAANAADDASEPAESTADPSPSDPSPPDEALGSAPDPDDLLAEAMGGESDGAATEEPAPPADDSVPEASPSEPSDNPTPDGGSAVAASPAGDADPSPATGEDSEPTSETDAEPTSDADTSTSDTERTTLRITRDVGEIFGVDQREYDLASEDVVTLPTTNAEPLLERDAAERLDAE